MRYRLWGSLLLLPILTVALVTIGCSSDKGTDRPKPGPGKTDGKASGTTPSSSELTAIKPAGFATIKGKVTFAGEPPTRADLAPKMEGNTNKSECLKGDHLDPTWIVSADKGVKNVVVWVQAPRGKYFEVPPDQQKPAEMKKQVGQPFCAFEPHVQVLYPSFYDDAAKKQKKTGQVFQVVNNASFSHNTNWSTSDSLLDPGGNELLSSNTNREVELFKNGKNKPGLKQLLTLKCNIHQWMTGYVWAFDHPYATVTGDDGTFEIVNVPAGTELVLVGWHEGDYVLPQGKGSAQGEKLDPLKDKETKTVDFTISK